MFDTDEKKSRDQVPSSRSVTRRRAVLFSVLVHLSLLIVMLCWYVPNHLETAGQIGKARLKTAAPQQAILEEVTHMPPSAGENIPSEQIQASLKSAIGEAETLSADLQLSELENKLERLNSISSPASVQDTTQKIATTLGLPSGPTPNSRAVDGSFDINTAQIHDVIRSRDNNGAWVYQSVLVDAAGRTQEVNLPTSEGEVSYSTFQQLKNFPNAEGIYRQVVMPMLQNMLNAIDVADAQARELRKKKNNEESGKKGAETDQQRIPPNANIPAELQ